MKFRIGIDIGGTFTDLVLIKDTGERFIYKEDSTPREPLMAITRGLEGLAREAGLSSTREMLSATDVLVHGQTRATNALIEKNGPKVGLLCTEGFRDITYFGNAGKPERFNIRLPKPEDFVPRYLRIGIPERIAKGGRVIRPLDHDALREAADYLKRHEIKAVAIAFLWSFANPDHERQAKEILQSEMPEAHIFCSADVLPEIGEWERTSATVLSAYISPIISDYLRAFEVEMHEDGLRYPPLIMQVNGGCTPVPDMLAKPINAVASGPAAAPAAGAYYASSTRTPENLIIVDMGGTSFDICMLRHGEPVMSTDIKVADQPIGVNSVEVLSIGAGGGSIAWVDSGGELRVGPRSAGSEPGPACYGRGGTMPTVTDANLVAGRMSTGAFLGGRRGLDVELARRAIEEHVARPLGMSVTDAAMGILTIVNNNMVSAIRKVSIERGIDPREYAMVAGGGAGGLHAADCARILGMKEVMIPRLSGGLCAFGMAITPVRHDYVRVLNCLIGEEQSRARIERAFADMVAEAVDDLRRDGFAEGDASFTRYMEARYHGQVHSITIPLAEGPIDSSSLARLAEDFHREHETLFTYAMHQQAIESLHWRLVVTAGKPGLMKASGPGAAKKPQPSGERDALLPAVGKEERVESFQWDSLAPGVTLHGPLIVESSSTTIVVNPGDTALVEEDGSLLLSISV
jgi:N-methylhydantoinase A